MSDFFSLYTLTPWDGLNTDELTSVQVVSLQSIFKKYPVIEPSFFDDITTNIKKYPHYYYVQCIKRIVGPKNEDYDIKNWIFLWAFDTENRMFQFLIQKDDERGIIAGIAPPELAKLFSEHGKGAILRILSLLNTPLKIKFLMLLFPKGKSIAESYNFIPIDKNQLIKIQNFKKMANLPNIQGQWFPSHAPRCPICNAVLTDIKDYNIGFGKIICPRCGYEKHK